MSESMKSLLSEASKLPPVDRVQLIEELLSSFEFSNRNQIDELWAKEAENRIEAYKKGKLTARSYQEVFNEINKM
ncbi:MAG: addiction module protein [Spirochaetia bacterium]|nr:addiction module protein [Spirochaetia bacterium]